MEMGKEREGRRRKKEKRIYRETFERKVEMKTMTILLRFKPRELHGDE
jgi:hypothetical protein